MSGFLVQHGAHAIVLGGPVVALGGLFLMLQLTRPDRRRVRRSAPVVLLALAWVGAASVHLLVIKEHFEEQAVLGVFFLLLSAAQLGYAVAVLLRCSQRLLTVGLLANLSVVALWAYTRTVAMPLGLGGPESVGVADLTATACEVVAVVLASVALRRQDAHVAPPPGLEPGTFRLTVERSAN